MNSCKFIVLQICVKSEGERGKGGIRTVGRGVFRAFNLLTPAKPHHHRRASPIAGTYVRYMNLTYLGT